MKTMDSSNHFCSILPKLIMRKNRHWVRSSTHILKVKVPYVFSSVVQKYMIGQWVQERRKLFEKVNLLQKHHKHICTRIHSLNEKIDYPFTYFIWNTNVINKKKIKKIEQLSSLVYVIRFIILKLMKLFVNSNLTPSSNSKVLQQFSYNVKTEKSKYPYESNDNGEFFLKCSIYLIANSYFFDNNDFLIMITPSISKGNCDNLQRLYARGKKGFRTLGFHLLFVES